MATTREIWRQKYAESRKTRGRKTAKELPRRQCVGPLIIIWPTKRMFSRTRQREGRQTNNVSTSMSTWTSNDVGCPASASPTFVKGAVWFASIDHDSWSNSKPYNRILWQILMQIWLRRNVISTVQTQGDLAINLGPTDIRP